MTGVKRTTGRLKVVGVGLDTIVSENGHAPVLALIYGKVSANDAARLAACWNAFEPGGAVELAREALREVVEASFKYEGFATIQISAGAIEQARAALAALDAVKEGEA